MGYAPAPAIVVHPRSIASKQRPPWASRLASAALGLALGAGVSARQLSGDVKGLVDRHLLTQAKVGVVIMDASTGQTLAAYNADEALIPASNMKIVTSAVALGVLGPDFNFETTLERDGGRLILRGSGDPGLADPELLKEMKIGVEDVLGAWVEAVRKTGGGGVTEIVMDDRVFDRQLTHPTWPADQLNRWYCAEVSGLTFHTNILSVFLKPTQPNQPPVVTFEPAASWVDVQNRAVSRNTGTNKVSVTRSSDANDFVVRGEVRFASEEPVDVALHDPAQFLGRLLADRLKAAGLGEPTVRAAGMEEALTPGQPIAVVRTPMATAMRRCNVNSYNLFAECLLKRAGREVTGQPGSWENGAAAVRMALQERLGPQDASSVSIADGSGMSRDNRVSAGVLARLLANVQEDARIGPAYVESFPEAKKEGSLKARFKGKPLRLEVRAKTGYIRSVSSLSGYVSDSNGTATRRVVFSVIVNDWPRGVQLGNVRAFQDDVVMLAHDYLAARTTRGAAQGGN